MAAQVFSPIKSHSAMKRSRSQERDMENSPGPAAGFGEHVHNEFLPGVVVEYGSVPNKRGRLTNAYDENSSPQSLHMFAAGGSCSSSPSKSNKMALNQFDGVIIGNNGRFYPEGKRMRKHIEQIRENESDLPLGEDGHARMGAPSAQLYKYLESQVDTLSERVRTAKSELTDEKEENAKLREALLQKEDANRILSRGLTIADGKMKEMQAQLNSIGMIQAQAQQAQSLFQENERMKQGLTMASEHIEGLERTVQMLRECLDKGGSGVSGGFGGGFGPPDVY